MEPATSVPPLPERTLTRERLLARLSAWDDRKLVVIHGPAGQGKSTLAAQFAQSRSMRTVWLSLGVEDGDPGALLARIGRAVLHALPGPAPLLPPVPRDRVGRKGLTPAATAWMRDLFGSLPGPLRIILDDCHFARPVQVFNDLVTGLLDASPRHLRVLLLSRTDPGLSAVSLRTRQAVAELAGKDLRFTDDETQELFGALLGMPLSRSDAAAVNRIAEGWPAGLVLMHGYLASSDPEGGIAALASRRPPALRKHIFDYLAQEVVSHLPGDLQDFLMRASVAAELPLPLLSELTGLPPDAPATRPSVRAVIRELTSRNLFVTAGDGPDATVRFHALLREYLMKRFREIAPAVLVQRCARTAAGHFLAAGEPVAGVTVLLDAGLEGEALRAIESQGSRLVARGSGTTVLRWLDALPAAAAERPWPLFFRALACRFTDPSASLALAERARAGFHRSRDLAGQMLALSSIIESCFHAGGDFRRMTAAASRARTLLRQRAAARQDARLRLALGMAWFFTGRLRDGADELQQAMDLFAARGDPFSQVTCAIYLAPCALYHGDFPLARLAVSRGSAALEELPGETGGRAALFLIRAMTALFEGNFAEARDCVDRCGTLAQDHSYSSLGFLSYAIGGWVRIAQGDLHGAIQLLERCKRASGASRHAFFASAAAHLLAIARYFAGDHSAAERESNEALGVQARSGSRLFRGIYLIASGAIRIQRGRLRKAEQDLLSAVRLLRQVQAAQQEANARLLLASIDLAQGRGVSARKHLVAGFGTGASRGFTYYALLRPEELAGLANAAIAMGIEASYCGRLLESLSDAPAGREFRVHCLGGFRIERRGRIIGDSAWKGRLSRNLVKLLAVRGRRGVSRDEALEAFWPDREQERSLRLLNSLVHRTRQVLEPGRRSADGSSCILQEGSRLRLNPARVWTDVAEFEALHSAAGRDRSMRGADGKRALAVCDQAFSLYQGDLLPSDSNVEWLQGERDRLRRMHTGLLRSAAELAGSAAGMASAEPYYERMFALDPCSEDACQWLMRRYVSEGRRGEAVRVYEQCELALGKELDLEPDERTKGLYRSIIGG